MARPTVFTKEVVDALEKAIRMGATLNRAADAAGISYETLNNWMNGKFPRGLDEEQKELKLQFLQIITRARGVNALRHLSTIMQAAAQGDWRASAWALEHQYPEDYGMKRVEVTGKDGGPVQINHVQQKIQELAAQVAAEEGIEEYGEDLVKTVVARIKGEEDAKS